MKCQGMVGKIVDDESVSANPLAVVVQRRTEIMSPVARREAVILCRSRDRSDGTAVGSRCAISRNARAIAGGREQVGDRRFIRIESALATTDSAYAGLRVVPSGQEFSPRRSADLADVKIFQRCPVAGQGVDIGCREIGVAIDSSNHPSLDRLSKLRGRWADVAEPASTAMTKPKASQKISNTGTRRIVPMVN